MLNSDQQASLPANIDTGSHPVPLVYQTQVVKGHRNRQAHNLRERRHRNNINKTIQELSHLAPPHRLKGQRGYITAKEKDKGPTKGDVLNGAVSWTRDLMLALHAKIQRESELANIIASLGGQLPFEQTEDEKWMRSELFAAMSENNSSIFPCTRELGRGLKVPDQTTVFGNPLGTLCPESLDSGIQSSGSGANSGSYGQPQFHYHHGQEGFSFADEDEYGKDIHRHLLSRRKSIQAFTRLE